MREGEGGKERMREGERWKCVMGKRPGNCYIHSISHKQPTKCLGYKSISRVKWLHVCTRSTFVISVSTCRYSTDGKVTVRA